MKQKIVKFVMLFHTLFFNIFGIVSLGEKVITCNLIPRLFDSRGAWQCVQSTGCFSFTESSCWAGWLLVTLSLLPGTLFRLLVQHVEMSQLWNWLYRLEIFAACHLLSLPTFPDLTTTCRGLNTPKHSHEEERERCLDTSEVLKDLGVPFSSRLSWALSPA